MYNMYIYIATVFSLNGGCNEAQPPRCSHFAEADGSGVHIVTHTDINMRPNHPEIKTCKK